MSPWLGSQLLEELVSECIPMLFIAIINNNNNNNINLIIKHDMKAKFFHFSALHKHHMADLHGELQGDHQCMGTADLQFTTQH